MAGNCERSHEHRIMWELDVVASVCCCRFFLHAAAGIWLHVAAGVLLLLLPGFVYMLLPGFGYCCCRGLVTCCCRGLVIVATGVWLHAAAGVWLHVSSEGTKIATCLPTENRTLNFWNSTYCSIISFVPQSCRNVLVF